MKLIPWFFIFATAWSLNALALTDPTSSPNDDHVKVTPYRSDEVFRVPIKIGKATLIQLEQGETVDDPTSGLGMGDAKAWHLSPRGNNIFLKPATELPDTNLIIATNKQRTYAFTLVTAKKNEVPVYLLRFTYPDTEAKLTTDAIQKREQKYIEEKQISREVKNDRYFMRGDTTLAPTAAWDNGEFTFLQFDTGRSLPMPFVVDADGKESIPNRHQDGNTIIVHQTAARFHLRLDDLVLQIDNDGYNPDPATRNLGTSINGLVRTVKEPE